MADRINSPGWATYLRVSDEDKQTPERSFAMQRQRIQEHLLTSSNIPFKREYTDMLTGTSPNRTEYQQMLVDAESGMFSHLGLYRADRFGRNTVEGLQSATRLIGLGIKIRVAHMPSLRPEEPDGFFMFLIQMGLAQREVDVLKQRTADGMAAKMRAGGWPQRAPDGYVNKERLVSSNKYERWIEIDPEYSQVIRYAWDLLLTGRYTMIQICEELANMGYSRRGGSPWVWEDTQTGKKKHADNRLHRIFHNPFYAGWAVSERFGIKKGEVRGQWEPIITPDEFEKGNAILRQHDDQKSRNKKQFYLLRGLVSVEENNKRYKMYVSTPSGCRQSYSYYITHTEINGKRLHIPSGIVDEQIDQWVNLIQVDPTKIPAIRKLYQFEIKNVTHDNREETIDGLKRQLTRLKDEEGRLGRLLITNKISETTYDQLRKEWQEKIQRMEINIADLERETLVRVDDLDVALVLMGNISLLYQRLKGKNRATLLQILVKQFIVDVQGKIINCELNSPFTYLKILANEINPNTHESCSSTQVFVGAPKTAQRLC
ncbi:MAG: recombinase family protein [Anaerolineales bacterium]|nr:recombinase family protein [Anaerolineales bacterium]